MPRLDAPDTLDVELSGLPGFPDTTFHSAFVERYSAGRGADAGTLLRTSVGIPTRTSSANESAIVETTTIDAATFTVRASTRRITTAGGDIVLDERHHLTGNRLRRIRARAGAAPDTIDAPLPAAGAPFATFALVLRAVPLATSLRGAYAVFTPEPPFSTTMVIDSVVRTTPIGAPPSSTVFDLFAHRDSAGVEASQLRASVDSSTRDVLDAEWHLSNGTRTIRRSRRDPRTPVPVRAVAAGSAQRAARRSIAGHYYLEGQREVGSELLLLPNGRFQYMLAYGAMDESSEGTWSVADGSVVLQTDGMAHAPSVTLMKSEGTARDSFTVIVTDPRGQPVSGIEIDFTAADAAPRSVRVRNGRYTYRFEPGAEPVEMSIGYSIVDFMPSFTLTRPPAAAYHVTFDRGDLGIRRFESEAMHVEGTTLFMSRNGRRLRYVRH